MIHTSNELYLGNKTLLSVISYQETNFVLVNQLTWSILIDAEGSKAHLKSFFTLIAKKYCIICKGKMIHMGTILVHIKAFVTPFFF